MTRKKKIMAALAIGAVALCIGSGIARCTLAPQEETEAPSQEQQATQQEGQPQGGADAQGGFADLENTAWTTEDGKSTLSIIKGAFIEKNESGSTILYYTVSDEKPEKDKLTATLDVSASMTGDEEQTIALVRNESNGSVTITCDKLAAKYVKDVPADTTMKLAGATDKLYETFGTDEGAFTSVILEYAKARSPHATKAVWGKEVWIDFGAGTYLTNFTLDDAASTIVTVQMDASGKLGAL